MIKKIFSKIDVLLIFPLLLNLKPERGELLFMNSKFLRLNYIYYSLIWIDYQVRAIDSAELILENEGI